MSGGNSDRDLNPLPQQQDYTVLAGSSSRPVSVQLIQEIFSEITGRTESLSESFNRPYQIDFSNIEDLYHRITQSIEQYTTISANCSAVIYYVNNQKDELKSFDRLAFHSAGSVSPVESIFLKYDFLTLPSKTSKTQSYTVIIRIASSIAIRKIFETDSAVFRAPPAIIRLMGDRTAYSKIEYIDYAVARNLQAAIKDWFSVLPTADQSHVILFLQKYSHYIPRVVRFLTTLFSSFFCYQEIKESMPLHNTDLTFLAEAVLTAFMVIYSSYVLSSWFGEYAEKSIDSWFSLSYIRFNKGDELEISKYKTKNKKSVAKAVLGVILGFSMSVLTKLVAATILIYITGKH